MTSRSLALLAAFGSFSVIMGAFGFQYIGEIAPCKLCIWQRWPHGAAVVIGLIILALPHRSLYLLGAAAALTTAVIGFYHTGVEMHWWLGPNTCTSQSIQGLSSEDLMSQILNAPLVRCDEVPWSLFGLSIATLNGITSLGLCGLWIAAFFRK